MAWSLVHRLSSCSDMRSLKACTTGCMAKHAAELQQAAALSGMHHDTSSLWGFGGSIRITPGPDVWTCLKPMTQHAGRAATLDPGHPQQEPAAQQEHSPESQGSGTQQVPSLSHPCQHASRRSVVDLKLTACWDPQLGIT